MMRVTMYTKLIQQATGCTVAQAHEIEDGIRAVGGFTGLDHLTRSELIKYARAVKVALKIN